MKDLTPQELLNNSRKLRTTQTPWEHKLWKRLRAGRFFGLKFKRQAPLGDYIVDFYCHSKKIVIEIDGGQHNYDLNKFLDKERQKTLEKQGFLVLRFWNNEIQNNLDGVLETIKVALNI